MKRVYIASTTQLHNTTPNSVLGIYTDRAKAEAAAEASLTDKFGVIANLIKVRKEAYAELNRPFVDPVVVSRGSISTTWCFYKERMDWKDMGGTIMCAKVVEAFLIEDQDPNRKMLIFKK